jgi:hypothetical protein
MQKNKYDEAREVTDDVRNYVNDLRSNVEEKLGKTYTTWEPVAYRSKSAVLGVSYKVKVRVDDSYCHVKFLIHQSGDVKFGGATDGHKESDPIKL